MGSMEQDTGSIGLCRNTHHDLEVQKGALEILGLWRLLGDGYRLSCMYECQVVFLSLLKQLKFAALDVSLRTFVVLSNI